MDENENKLTNSTENPAPVNTEPESPSQPVSQPDEPAPQPVVPTSYPYGQAPAPNQGYPYSSPNTQNRYYGSSGYYGAPQQKPPYPPANGQQHPEPPKAKHSKTGKTVFIVLVCICLLLGSISIGFVVGKSNNSGSTKKTPSDSTNLVLENTPDEKETTGTDGELSASAIYDKVNASSVGILVYSNGKNPFGSASSSLYGEGSGVVMGENSAKNATYIITCAHVVSDSGVTVKVQTANGDQYDATIVGSDTKTDIAVLSIKTTGLQAASFGKSSDVKVGQTLYAIGNPGGTEFFGSFTRGMVSAIGRPVDSPVGYEMSCIQHDAAINPGNSGGALVNAYGQVIGINSSKIADEDYEGMGFAVPSETVKEIVDEIIANGYITNRAKLGITYATVSQSQTYSMVVQLKDYPAGSLIISDISSDSSLSSSNAQKGDLIIKANGNALTTADVLLDLVENGSIGDKITLTIVHIGSNYETTEFDVVATLVEDKGDTVITTEATTNGYYNPFGNN